MNYSCFNCKYSRLESQKFICNLSSFRLQDAEAQQQLDDAGLKCRVSGGIITLLYNGDSLPDYQHVMLPCVILDPNKRGYFKDKG